MLPDHRRILNGRTFAEMWHPARYGCALEVPKQPTILQRIGQWLARWFT